MGTGQSGGRWERSEYNQWGELNLMGFWRFGKTSLGSLGFYE